MAEGAAYIDSTILSVEEVVGIMMERIRGAAR